MFYAIKNITSLLGGTLPVPLFEQQSRNGGSCFEKIVSQVLSL
jgi:hypothetical protein